VGVRLPLAFSCLTLVVLLAGCVPAATPPGPTASPAAVAEPTRTLAPSPISSPSPSPSPATLASLSEANRAFLAKEYSAALREYRQVAERSAGAGGQPDLTAQAARAFARFRIVLIDALVGQEDDARAILETMRQQDGGSPLTGLAALFWDTYGMTADPRAACGVVTRRALEGPTALDGTLGLRPEEICVVPG
jgi:hypothetical protein